MAKRFKMLAPFDSISGNVSGAQKLAYPVNGQRAYEGPAGKNYAQNYKPRFIMNERKSDGRLYFQVKQRSATTITARSKRAMAVLGGCGAILGAILKDKTSALYLALYEAWLVTKPFSAKTGQPSSFREYMSAFIMGALRAKSAVISVLWNNDGTPAFISINNPFVSGGEGTYDVTISDSALIKFWSELANNPVEFIVDGRKGIAHSGDTFGMICASKNNVLDLAVGPEITIEGQSYTECVIGDSWEDGDKLYAKVVVDGSNIELQDTTVTNGKEYTTIVGEQSQG